MIVNNLAPLIEFGEALSRLPRAIIVASTRYSFLPLLEGFQYGGAGAMGVGNQGRSEHSTFHF